MKNLKNLHRLASLALFAAAACSGDTSEVNAAELQGGSGTAPSLQDALGDMGSVAKEKAAQLADAFRDKLAGTDGRLAELAKKLEGTEGAAREKLATTLADLEEQRKEVGAKLAELGKQGGAKLEAAKLEVERATAELAQDIARALEQFK